jgi:hypothetical protein
MPAFKTLRLIGKRHRIQWDCPDLVADDGDKVDGQFDATQKLIQIAAGQTHDDERETLLHEVLHALEVQMHAHIPEDKLRQLAVGLYAAVKDNPRLVQYLLEEEEEDADVEVGPGSDSLDGGVDRGRCGDHGGLVRDA